jgi:hypothetical protein
VAPGLTLGEALRLDVRDRALFLREAERREALRQIQAVNAASYPYMDKDVRRRYAEELSRKGRVEAAAVEPVQAIDTSPEAVRKRTRAAKRMIAGAVGGRPRPSRGH